MIASHYRFEVKQYIVKAKVRDGPEAETGSVLSCIRVKG